MNAIVEHKPQKAALVAGGHARAIVPQDFDGCWRLATAVCAAGMAPKGLDTPEKATVAIMHGLEVGLTPMAALQSIAVVNGRPTIWGDGAMALVRASGLCDGVDEIIEGTGDAMAARCVVKRGKETIVRSFTVAQARKAGLWGKAGPWSQYPERMLAMRARAFALRDGFADVLRGLGIAEEVHDTPTSTAPVAPLVAPPPPPDEPVVDEKPVAPPPPDEAGETVEELFQRAEKWGAGIAKGDFETLETYRDEFEPMLDSLGEDDRSHLAGIIARHRQRVDPVTLMAGE